MAVITIRARQNDDHSVILHKRIDNKGADYWTAQCCCGWRGNVTVRRHLAADEAMWHTNNHANDRWLVWLDEPRSA